MPRIKHAGMSGCQAARSKPRWSSTLTTLPLKRHGSVCESQMAIQAAGHIRQAYFTTIAGRFNQLAG